MAADNMIFKSLTSGSFVVPAGFVFLSINPGSGASYRIANSLTGDIANVGNKTSGAYSIPYTFPDPPGAEGWAEHTITWIAGTIEIAYASGL